MSAEELSRQRAHKDKGPEAAAGRMFLRRHTAWLPGAEETWRQLESSKYETEQITITDVLLSTGYQKPGGKSSDLHEFIFHRSEVSQKQPLVSLSPSVLLCEGRLKNHKMLPSYDPLPQAIILTLAGCGL